jgi:DNA-binding NtrC family response regulator
MYLEKNCPQEEVRPQNMIHQVWIIDEDMISQDTIDEAFMNLGRSLQLRFFDDLMEMQVALSTGYHLDPDLIIMDLGVNASNYEEPLRSLKKMLPGCRIVVWNNDYYMSQHTRIQSLGVTDVLRKPFEVDIMSKVLKNIQERYLV